MNINDYEAIEKRVNGDMPIRDKLASAVFYANGRARNPRFSALWTSVSDEEKAACVKIGLAAALALVDDWTTPGCDCNYCTNARQGKTGPGYPIMCHQRWEKMPSDERMEICDSMDG